MSFINCSNHVSANWGDAQKSVALFYGDIIDVPFPNVPVTATEDEIMILARKTADEILSHKPDAVMCMGEFTLTFAVINILMDAGVKVVSACTERHSVEQTMPDGKTIKNSVFDFVGFREYRRI